MKRYNNISGAKKASLTSLLLGVGIILATCFVSRAADTTSTEKPTATIEMKYLKENGVRKMHLKVTNDDGDPISNMIVNVFLKERSKVGMQGNASTDEKGEGTVSMVKDRFDPMAGTSTDYHFIASAGSDDRYALSEAELDVKDVNLTVKTSVKDSQNIITARLFKIENGKEIPLADEEIHVYVKRMFRNLPLFKIDDDGKKVEVSKTDSNGEFTVICPNDLPGDAKGNITVMASIEENETYGNVTAEEIVPWGKPLVQQAGMVRALWGDRANAPYWLVLLSCGIVGGVWITILYVVLQLFRIKRMAKNPAIK